MTEYKKDCVTYFFCRHHFDKMTFVLLILWLVCAHAIAATQPDQFNVVHEKRNPNLNSWQRQAAADSNISLQVRIALVQRNLDKAEEELLRVSDPSSLGFGKHRTRSQVENWVRSTPQVSGRGIFFAIPFRNLRIPSDKIRWRLIAV